MNAKLVQWARSKAEFERMQRDGWKVAKQRATHHSEYSVLMERERDNTEMG